MGSSTGVMGGAVTHGGQVDSELACPVSPVVDIVFSRWTTPILWTLNEFGRQRFVELQRNIRTITPKVLTQRLRQMERDGLIVRTYHPEVPPRVEYEISDLGRSLAPIFAHLADWSAGNLHKVERARREFDQADERASAPR
ncbi:winged helix-turn-helix transcriptional regulator [Streptomyces sp. NPDC051041]|uniref:winged helix-turn-helix transcriptional regulator n=1 Tax=Streptomyces sp. NPDC051041 TaxID=3365640 RepID=UPI0037B11141